MSDSIGRPTSTPVRPKTDRAVPEPDADAEPEPGLPGTKMTGAYEAMMELSMYVGEEEWDSAQRHIRPASRRVSLRDAQAYTVAAYEKERQAKENGDG